MRQIEELVELATRAFVSFDTRPGPIRCAELGDGLINETFLITSPKGRGERRWVLQRINGAVLADLELVMTNIARVTEHLQAVVKERYPNDWHRRALRLVPTVAGDWFVRDTEGNAWRCYHFIEGSRVYRRADRVDHARAAARAFGEFLTDLQDLPIEAIRPSIPGLHDTPARLAALHAAAEQDALGRLAGVEPELAALLDREASAAQLADAQLPLRVVHNDTKLNNVLFDQATDQPLCVVDLDTVMPGLALHDFGDLVRSAAASGFEDALNVRFRFDLFEALVAGYLEGAGAILTDTEQALMAIAPRVITLELAVRFLTDYLQGDRYFKTSRPGQNLDRCRAQLALLEDMERFESHMQRVVREKIST